MRIQSPKTAAALRGGFTLIEVMLVAMIMGMMFVSISQLMQAARRTRDTIYNFQETQLAGPKVLEMISRDIAGLYTTNRPRTDWLKVTDRTVNGQEADRIDFVTTTDSLLVRSGDDDEPVRSDINEVGYVLRPSKANDEFLEIYRREDFGVDDEPMSGGEYTFLSDQVKEFNIEVFAEDGPDGDPEDEWGPESVAPLPGTVMASEGGAASTTRPDAPTSDGIGGLPAWIKISLTIELKPRIDRESMNFSGSDKRTITYIRNIRFSDGLRVEEGSIPRFGIPPAPSGSGADSGVGTGDEGDGNIVDANGDGVPDGVLPGDEGGGKDGQGAAGRPNLGQNTTVTVDQKDR